MYNLHVINQLSQLSTHVSTPISNSFLDEHILEIRTNSLPWCAHIVKYRVTSRLQEDWDFNARIFLRKTSNFTFVMSQNCFIKEYIMFIQDVYSRNNGLY